MPEPGFGDLEAPEPDMPPAAASEDTTPWKTAGKAPGAPGASPFGGGPFEPAAPDLFGFEHGDFASSFSNSGAGVAPSQEQQFLSLAAAGGGLVAGTAPQAQLEMGQASAFQPAVKQPPRPASALDDLNMAIQQAMGGGKKPSGTAVGFQGQGALEQGVPAFGVASASGGSSPARSITFTGSGVAGLDSFGDVLQPKQTTGGPRAPEGVRPAAAPAGGLLKGDLDSTLASLAQNLDMNGPKQAAVRKTSGAHQWGSPKPAAKTGGSNWVPGGGPGVPAAAPAAAAAPAQVPWAGSPQHMFQPVPGAPVPAGGGQWGATGGMMGSFGQPQGPMMPQPAFQMGMMRPMGQPMVGGMGPGMAPVAPVQQAPLVSMFPAAGMGSATGASPAVNDPFGAL